MSCAYVNVYEGEFKKRSGHDIVKFTVNSYLRRRQYMNAEHIRKSEMVLYQNSKQMTIAATVLKDTSTGNSFSYKTINNDITLAEQQFSKFKTWVTECVEGKYQQELYLLLFPLLCHLYLEIIRGGVDRQATAKFLKRHQELVVGHEDYRGIIEDLSQVHTTQDIDNKPLIKAFRSSKYEIKISSVAHAALQKHLTSQSHLILMQILKTWFDIEVVTSSNVLEMEEDIGDDTSEDMADNLERFYQQTPGDKETRNLQESLKLIRASPTPPPPLLLYSLNNTEGVCCAKVSRSGKLLATGYSSSQLKLWSVSESKMNPTTFNASVNLATYTPTHLQTVQEQRHTSLRGHTGPVTGVEFLHEADVFLSVSYDSTMRAWRLTDYSPAAVYRGHNYPVWCVAASSLGLYIATGSRDLTARLWSLDRIFPTRIFAGHSDDVNCVQFHPNGNYLATGSTDHTIRLWSVTDCEVVRVYGVNSGSILALAFSPNGQYLASAGDDRKVRVWDLTSGGMLAELRGHAMAVTALDWSMDSNMLASASIDGTVMVWNSSLHFKPPVSENAVNPAKYTTTCTSILSLQSLLRGNLVAVGSQPAVLSSSDDTN